MPNSGGNSSSSKQGYQQLKGGGQNALDVRTLNATEAFASDENLGIWEPGYTTSPPDRQFGYPFNITDIPGNTEDTQGNSGWNGCDPGPGIVESRMVAGSSDPTPGGGFTD